VGEDLWREAKTALDLSQRHILIEGPAGTGSSNALFSDYYRARMEGGPDCCLVHVEERRRTALEFTPNVPRLAERVHHAPQCTGRHGFNGRPVSHDLSRWSSEIAKLSRSLRRCKPMRFVNPWARVEVARVNILGEIWGPTNGSFD